MQQQVRILCGTRQRGNVGNSAHAKSQLMVQQPTKLLIHTEAQAATAAYEATATFVTTTTRHPKHEGATATHEGTATFDYNSWGDQPEAELKSSLKYSKEATAQEGTDIRRKPSTTSTLQQKLEGISRSGN